MSNTVIVVGGGAREHALVWKLAQSPAAERIICAPGNPGTAGLCDNVKIGVLDLDKIVELAELRQADLVVVGPEAPLAAGLADRLTELGIRVCGPSRQAAQIESSKSWAKSLMNRAGVPTARSSSIISEDQIASTLRDYACPVVIKADGLAAGKGVVIAETETDAVSACRGFLTGTLLGQRSSKVLIEEFLEGREVSVLALTDGASTVPLAPACDYKRAFDDDEGPNTGGMGAYAPVPLIDQKMMAHIQSAILEPTINAMRDAGTPMKGVLYAGLMLTSDGPIVLEFNARFGDPETQVILPLLKSDLFALLYATATGTLASVTPPEWSSGTAVGVVLASGEYPGSFATGLPISELDHSINENTLVFHAGTSQDESGALVTAGGRVLTVVGIGKSFDLATDRAYATARSIAFEGMHFRSDIAARERSR